MDNQNNPSSSNNTTTPSWGAPAATPTPPDPAPTWPPAQPATPPPPVPTPQPEPNPTPLPTFPSTPAIPTTETPAFPANPTPPQASQSNPWDFLANNNSSPFLPTHDPSPTPTPAPSQPLPNPAPAFSDTIPTPSGWPNLSNLDIPSSQNQPPQTPSVQQALTPDPIPQPDPLAPASANSNLTSTSNWMPTPSTSAPQPETNTLNSIPSAPATNPQASSPNLSHLDNPWGTPLQSPPVDGSGSTVQPSWVASIPSVPTNELANAPITSEAAPTDLSHLISNNPTPENVNKPTPETLVTPTVSPTAEISAAPTQQEHKGIPVWLIGIGIGLLILVAAGSAYFILGIGQTKTTTSIPATIGSANETQATKPPVLPPTTQPAASGSASFGDLQGNSGTTNATSAADLLRQRQQEK